MSPTTEGALPRAENVRLFQEGIARDLLDGCTPQERPVAVIVCGQTGAGKTAITAMVKDALDRLGSAAWINMDFYNPYHPHYARWQAERPQEADALVRPDGDLWWEQAQDYALSRGYNILLESAAVSPAEFEDICRRIQDAPRPPGAAPYRIEAAFVAVAGPISEFGTRDRFVHEVRELGHGRLVDREIHNASLDGVLRSAAAFEREGLGDLGLVMRRDGSPVYSRTVTPGLPVAEDQLTLVHAVQRERDRQLTPLEAAQFAARYADTVLRAPAFMSAELADIARAVAPLLPEPTTRWTDLAEEAQRLRGAVPGVPDPTLPARSDADLVQLLAHSVAERHAAGEAGPSPRSRRILAEMARRSVLPAEQRAYEASERQRLRSNDAQLVTKPGSTLPVRPSTATAARSRSTTGTRPPQRQQAQQPLPPPQRTGPEPQHRPGHSR
ncbi:zeta toxin family protein [Streptomyces californicus]|uniref:zeta toxin family protein n=1 Tax=Streptomyces californicus TaxID=67351 RepID=UPI00367C4FBB